MKNSLYSIVLLAGLPVASLAQTMPGEALIFLDQDGNQQVTQDEISEQMDLLFAPMDTNGDGGLTYSEVEAFMSRSIFDGADASGNGVMSKSEYRAQITRDFQSADVNGNGLLD